MSTQNPVRYNLNGGPNLKDLMLALFDEVNGSPRVVRFEIEGGTPVEGGAGNGLISLNGKTMYRSIVIVITGVDRGLSYDDWSFRGLTALWTSKLKGYFNTRTRKGWAEFEREDITVREMSFGGDSIFGYDRAITVGDEIIALEGSGNKLTRGMVIGIQGDSRGYVPGGLAVGLGRIIGFCMPFQDGETDHIVQVCDHTGKVGWIKPSTVFQISTLDI